ncbi:type VII secretion target [Mycobacterium sp. DL99]|uniref:type VII secretion target n=1 Tax=Mycobacterium sp. DL99 TaxID=2528957 RepID=UPI001080E34B|nr:type VII secretion target [Mycobacterium sp. DL99]
MNQFVADTAAITGLQGTVGSVSEDMNNFKNAFSGPSDLASSHGQIGFPFQNSHGGAQSSRAGALAATQFAASRMAELLGQASQAYARGDMESASRLKAQADQLEGAGSAASGAGGGADPAGAGAGGAGQVLGQFGQMASQMAQSITQPLQGLTQAMTQAPQQVMQGVQGIVEAATQAAGGGGDAAATAADTGGAGAENAIKAADHQGPGDGAGGGPADQPDAKHDGRDDAEPRKHDGDRAPVGEAGAAADRSYEQLGNRASAGAAAEDGYGVGTVPTQIHNINPRRQ